MSITVLTPTIAAGLAADVYDTLNMPTGGLFVPKSGILKDMFDFGGHGGAIQGSSGRFFFRKDSGFAIVGLGMKPPYSNHVIIGFRGTKTSNDWLSNSNSGTVTIENQTQAHKGFCEIFNSIRPSLEQQLNPLLRAGGQQSGSNFRGSFSSQHGPGHVQQNASHFRGSFSSGQGSNHAQQAAAVKRAAPVVHCVGHSMGGALAQLAAVWIKKFYGSRIAVYTFGAPRVGLRSFAIQTPESIEATYRCVHSDDPVPMAPVWPFYHAPFNGQMVLLSRDTGIRPSSHSMRGPGHSYQTSAHGDWSFLMDRADPPRPVYLKYSDRSQVSFTDYWQHRIGDALTTILRDSGTASAFIYGAQSVAGGISTFYDQVAVAIEQSAAVSNAMAQHVEGLLGHMLVFAGKGLNVVIRLTATFIRWVFREVLARLHSAVRSALNGLS